MGKTINIATLSLAMVVLSAAGTTTSFGNVLATNAVSMTHQADIKSFNSSSSAVVVASYGTPNGFCESLKPILMCGLDNLTI